MTKTKAICETALMWATSQFSYKEFHALIRTIPEVNRVMTRGFTLNERNFQRDSTKKHILKVLGKRQDLAGQFLLALGRLFREGEGIARFLKTEGALKGLESQWREGFRSSQEDPRALAIALYRDEAHPRLLRLVDLLLRFAPGFWVGRKNPVTPSKGRAAQEMRRTLQETLQKAAEQRQAGEAPGEQHKATAEAETPPPQAAPPETGLLSLAPEGAAEDGGADREEDGTLREQLKRARQRNAELSLENGKLRKEARQQQARDESLRRQEKEERERLDRELREAREDFDQAIDELSEKFAQEQRLQMIAFYEEALGISMEKAQAQIKVRNDLRSLPQRVDAALEAQRERDRKYGLWLKTKEAIPKLEQQWERIREAMEFSNHVDDSLVALQKEVEGQLTELRRQLGVDEEKNPYGIFPRLVSHLKSLSPGKESSAGEWDEVEQFLQGTLAEKLFAPDEIDELKQMVAEGRRRFERQRKDLLLATAMPPLEECCPKERMEHVLLRSFPLEKLKEVELYIDGFNVIKNDPFMSQEEKAPGGFSFVRTGFTKKCKRLSRLFHKVTLVFDSDLPTDNISRENNFTLVYAARKQVEQNADNWIVERMAELEARAGRENAEAPRKRWLVTDDLGLRARVAEICDGSVDNRDFCAFLTTHLLTNP